MRAVGAAGYGLLVPYADPAVKREYARQWVAARRAEYFADKSCVECGSRDDLRLDHIDPRTKVAHAIWSWSQERREAELAKCQVLCEPCHQEKTRRDLEVVYGVSEPPHGANRYKSKTYRCRCTVCVDAHRADMAEWRRQRGCAGRSRTELSQRV